MYSKLAFQTHLKDSEVDEEINLPAPVPPNQEAGRLEKLLFSQLEVSIYGYCNTTISNVNVMHSICPWQEDDVFLFKTEYVLDNTSKGGGGYIYGVKNDKDIFRETVVDGKRTPKPNTWYQD